jgi:hypothetical protein
MPNAYAERISERSCHSRILNSYSATLGRAWYIRVPLCCRKMQLCVYNMIDEGQKGRKPGYIHEMGSHDLKSCEMKYQRNTLHIL